MNWLKKLWRKSRSKEYKFKSDRFRELYEKYEGITNEQYGSLIEEMQNDAQLKRYSGESALECVLDTGDFFRYLRGTKIIYNQGTFKILDISGCGFPDYMRAERTDLTESNIKVYFPSEFTPAMLKTGILKYIIELDQVYERSIDPKDYDRTGRFQGFEWLYNQTKK